MRRTAAALALAALTLAGCSDDGGGTPSPSVTATPRSESASPETPDGSESTKSPPADPEVVDTIASDLAVPWGLDFLPDGTAVVTERDSRRVLVIEGEQHTVRQIGTIDQAAPQGEAGLLGVAVSPTFDTDGRLFFYVTTVDDNRVVRATYDGSGLGDLEVVLDGIPNGFIHDGGRVEFGPDGLLYVSTGETGDTGLSQDEESLGGKILRITQDGDPAPGNPFDSAVWSYGHRNVQGLAFDDRDRLWASEFGSQDYDELNLIEPGTNYGWPLVEGPGGEEQGFTDPQVVWETAVASPSGLAFLDGRLWLASLRGARLWRIDVSGAKATNPTDFFVGEYGRMRTVAVAPDGLLWVTTSNRDGRGDPAENDDRILLIDPS